MASDRQLRQDVLDELEFEPSFDAWHIGVTAQEGVVTLTGHVSSYGAKLAAEQAARRVKGVLAIAEEIEVRLPADKKRADDEIAGRALAILNWDATIPAAGITVTVQKGILTLSGEVDWQFEKNQAERLVRRLGGVAGVINAIKLRPPVSATNVKDEIVKAFHRTAALEAAAIDVEVAGSTVTLKGRVHDRSERDAAERAAWSARGVAKVVDQIRVQH
ncbi:MAG: BON domain-containing protein [Alphaproteobacteria bacterium]|nr:BON domain-containing protein [Alphaproteobacteria bacterium]